MNHLIADNSIATMRSYLMQQLAERYEEREARNILHELFYHYKQWNRAEIQLHESDRLSESEILKFHFASKRLRQGEPLQYVTGVAHFFGLDLQVSPAVLIPRPETEELVQRLIEHNTLSAPTILDIGTGSGCIAVALKKNIRNAQVTAVDVSAEALAVAKSNAIKHETPIEFLHLDILKDELTQRRFDMIVSNPPYVLQKDKAYMQGHVVDHEPHLALFVDDTDPLLFYRRIVEVSKTHLTDRGVVFCEMHEDQERGMTQLFSELQVQSFSFHTDMQGKTRFVRFHH